MKPVHVYVNLHRDHAGEGGEALAGAEFHQARRFIPLWAKTIPGRSGNSQYLRLMPLASASSATNRIPATLPSSSAPSDTDFDGGASALSLPVPRCCLQMAAVCP